MRFPPSNWSMRWDRGLLANRRMLDPFRSSLRVNAVVTAATLAIALPAAYVITRLKVRGSELLYNLFTAPLLLPTIVVGLAVLIVFAPIAR